MEKNNKWPLAVVYWVDACGGHRMGWRTIDEVASMGAANAVSVGFVVSDTEDVIVVCPHMVDWEEGDGEIAIPKQWVKKIITIQ